MPRKRRIALFFSPELGYWYEILHGITKFSNLYGPWDLLLAHFGDITIEHLEPAMAVDGICFHHSAGQRIWEPILASGIPAVNLDGVTREHVASVGPDDLASGRIAATHLLERRFRHFGFCGFDMRLFSQERREGFIAALKEAGHSCHVFEEPTSVGTWGSFTAQNHLCEWLKSLPKPIGILACSDLRARHILLSCAACNIHVPEDAAVISVDNMSAICESITPPLTSIPLDGRRSGFEAAALLHQLMNGQTPPTTTVRIPPLPIVVRHSSDIYAIEDRAIASAVRYIADHAHEPIGVDTVCEAVAISRRSLEQRFRRVFNRGIHQEIARVRLNRVQQLLTETDMTMPEIARVTGLSNGQALSEFFRRLQGITPSAYRIKSREERLA